MKHGSPESYPDCSLGSLGKKPKPKGWPGFDTESLELGIL
jgi:hypothetical protein